MAHQVTGIPSKETERMKGVRVYDISNNRGGHGGLVCFNGERIIMHYHVDVAYRIEKTSNPTYPERHKVTGVKYNGYITDIASIRHLLNKIVKLRITSVNLLISTFAEQTIQVIMERFSEIETLWETRPRPPAGLDVLREYRKTDVIRILQSFFEEHSISFNQKWLSAIISKYDDTTDIIEALRQDPFRLYKTVKNGGMDFQTVDKLCISLGYAYHPIRVTNVCDYVFRRFNSQGQLYATRVDIHGGCSLCQITVDTKLLDLMTDSLYRIEYGTRFYYTTSRYRSMETDVERYCMQLMKNKPIVSEAYCKNLMVTGTQLCDEQRDAVDMAIRNSISLITGAPGTGKSYVIGQIYKEVNGSVVVLAPTGTAVEKLREGLGKRGITSLNDNVKTIHSFIGRDPDSEYVPSGTSHKIDSVTVCVDEMSMVSLDLFVALLKKLEAEYTNVRLVLCGDKDQLPSIQGGYVFGDMIRYAPIPNIKLIKQHRAENRFLIENAMRVLEGKCIEPDGDMIKIVTIQPMAGSSEQKVKAIEGLLMDVITDRNNNAKPDNSVVLLPTRASGICVDAFNPGLQKHYNPDAPEICEKKLCGFPIHINDKLINKKNNYKLGIYNGSILTAKEHIRDTVASIGTSSASISRSVNGVYKEQDIVPVTNDFRYKVGEQYAAKLGCIYHEDESDLADGTAKIFKSITDAKLSLAYAITVHAAQGKGYETVVIVLHSSMYHGLLTRKILYTALTRAKKRCIIITDQQALDRCVGSKDTARVTNLFQHRDKLQSIMHIMENIHVAVKQNSVDVATILKGTPINPRYLVIANKRSAVGLIRRVSQTYVGLSRVIWNDIQTRSRLLECIYAPTS